MKLFSIFAWMLAASALLVASVESVESRVLLRRASEDLHHKMELDDGGKDFDGRRLSKSSKGSRSTSKSSKSRRELELEEDEDRVLHADWNWGKNWGHRWNSGNKWRRRRWSRSWSKSTRTSKSSKTSKSRRRELEPKDEDRMLNSKSSKTSKSSRSK